VRIAWSAAAAIAIALLPCGARAQAPADPPPPAGTPPAAPAVDEATRSSARELGEQGNALFAAGDFAGALEKYERANALVPVPTLGVRIARCLVALGRLVEASERYLAVQRAGLPPSPLPVHHKALEDAKTERDALLPRIPALVVTVSPAGAEVTVDGAAMPAALLGEKRMVDPGKRVVVARAGEATRSMEVDVAEGAVVPVHVSIDGAPPPVPGAGPTTPPDEASGGSAWPIVGWSAVGVGGALTVVGVVTGLVAMGQRSDLEASCGAELACGPAFHEDAEGYNGLRTLSAVTFFAGLGVAAAGVTILLVDPGGGSETALRLGPGRVGLAGRF
jgi:hypothetical protein